MDLFATGKTALIRVDIQKGFDNVDYWEDNGMILMLNKMPAATFIVEKIQAIFSAPTALLRNPASILLAGNPGNEFKEIFKLLSGETVIQKKVNSAFIGTDPEAIPDVKETDTLVIVGFTTDHCVSTTAGMAANWGYKTFVVSDATTPFPKKRNR